MFSFNEKDYLSILLFIVGLKHLKVLDMNSCIYITNLSPLKEVASSLEYLDIGNCESLADVAPVADLQ